MAKLPALRKLWTRLFELSRPKGVVLREIQGSLMYLDAEDRGVSQILLLGVYEPFETALFKRSLRESMKVVDVGANIGYYSLLAARHVGETGYVFAIEANPVTFALLLRNVKINPYRNIVAINSCVSDCSGTAQFYINRTIPGESAVIINSPAPDGKAITIATASLDDILPHSAVDIMKMDIEGSEGLALMGASKLLQTKRPKIFMEFVPDRLARMGTEPEYVLSLLRKYGYGIYIINEKNRTLQCVPDHGTVAFGCNLFCSPKQSTARFLI